MTRPLPAIALVTFSAWLLAPVASGHAQHVTGHIDGPSPEIQFLLAHGHEDEHAGHAADGARSRVGQGTGVIQSVDAEGRSVTISHGPIDEIGMGAMTMGFGVVGAIDLSGFAEGDPVAFRLKRGRDNSFRVTEICNTGIDGTNCLDGAEDAS